MCFFASSASADDHLILHRLKHSLVMTEKRFRLVLLSCVLFPLISATLNWLMFDSLPPLLQEYLTTTAEAELTFSEIVLVFLFTPFVFVVVWNLTELYQFKNRSRKIALILTAISFLFYPLLGPSVYTWPEEILYGTSEILWGVLLTSAYLPPLNKRFNA